ncbi:MAG: alpha-hydroxy-acid oxidizing protein, partial [Neisseria subflava]|nr:alpha-hydroxy-acid oxidizing protein [Neisseria subflava]
GEEGVTRALEILYKEMDISMAFTGYRNIQDVDSSILRSTRWAQDEF